MRSKNSTNTAEEVLAIEIDANPENESVVDFRNKSAHQTVNSWSQWAAVAGFIPVPLVDATTIAGVQVKMIYDLCQTYEVEYKKELASSIIAALASGGVTTILSTSIGTTLARYIPVIGPTVSLVTLPALSFASTYAIGVTFIKHFENHGSLLDFDADRTKDFFNEQMAKAKSFFHKKSVDGVGAAEKNEPQGQPA